MSGKPETKVQNLIRVARTKKGIVPEFFTKDYRYQLAAQPYLTAIAHGVKDHPASRLIIPFWHQNYGDSAFNPRVTLIGIPIR